MENTQASQNKQFVLDFLKAVEKRQSSQDVLDFYHPHVEQIEYPNAILTKIAIRTLDDLAEASDSGMQILAGEKYEVQNIYAVDDNVIVEAIWTGTLAISIGDLEPGDTMTAYFAQFYEIRDGRIYKQRNYDCFEPFD